LVYVEGFGYRLLSGNGHASVKDGRYLVTHNHYDEALSNVLQQGDPEGLVTIYGFNSDGQLIFQVAAQDVSARVAGSEAVLLDFGETGGLGFFDALAVPSAGYLAQPSSALRPEMELAQIDWDGTTTHVDWVKILSVSSKAGVPIVTVDNCVGHGASGGGVFWQGQHIGNNWSRSSQCSQAAGDGELLFHGQRTTVALDGAALTAP
jgi:hypothetical protein